MWLESNMASREDAEEPKFSESMRQAWSSDAELLDVIRKWQTHLGRHSGATTAPSPTAVATLRRILREKPPVGGVDGELRSRLRHKALTMLSTEVNAALDDETYREMLSELIAVLRQDKEENAEVALKILRLLAPPAQSSRHHILLQFSQQIASACQPFIQGPRHGEDGAQHQVGRNDFPPNEQYSPITSCSVRLIPLVSDFICSRSEAGDVIPYKLLAPCAWAELKAIRERVQPLSKSWRLDRQRHCKVLGELLTILDPAQGERMHSPGLLAKEQLWILQYLPPGTESLRLDILRRFEQGLQAEAGRGGYQGPNGGADGNAMQQDGTRAQDPTPGGQSPVVTERTPLWEVLGKKYLDAVIDSGRMQGRGRPCAEVQVSHAAILRALGQRKVDLNYAQIQRVMRIICCSLIDNSVPLSQKNTLIYYLHGLNAEYGRKRGALPRTAQFEILTCLVDLCRILRTQLADTLVLIRKQEANKRDEAQNKEEAKADEMTHFELGEKALLEAAKPYSSNSQTGGGPKDRASLGGSRPGEVTEPQKQVYGKVMWNLVASAELVFSIAREQRQAREGGSGTFLDPSELKVMKRLLLYGSEVIQGLAELWPASEGRPTVRFFADFFRRVRPLQLRDILNDIGPHLFAKVVEAKTRQYLHYCHRKNAGSNSYSPQHQQQYEEGVVSLVLGHFASFGPARQALEDEHVCTFLEAAFDFVSSRLTRFSAPESQGQGLYPEQELDAELAALPKAELQETLVDLALFVGEQALLRPSDIRAKHVFFSVFVFCVKQAKKGALVADHYYVIIIRLFRDLCTAEHDGLVKEFLPMIQGLLETFLQSRDSVPYIEVTNHIFECVPAKLKSLLDYLPVISKPVVESMRTVAHRDLERPLNTLQLWVSGLGQFPEILDPAVSHVLPELTGMLYKILYQLPNFPFKLLGKLGAKSRPYWQDPEVSTRRYSEGGLKIRLKDRHSGREVVLGIDAAIEVVLVKVFENPRAYSLSRMLDAFRLVKAALLCYIDSDIDVDYLIARIIAAKSRGPQHVDDEITEAAKAFDSSRRHNHGSFLARGSEAHAFEKILRSLLFACSLPEDNPDALPVGKKVLKFMKWVTQYFTLLYVCKDGRLQQSREDEVNPLKFLETISAFLLYNLRPGSYSPQQSSYFEGTVVCLDTMLQLLNKLFGDRPDVLSNLEIVGILIKKVCHLAYEQDLRKKLAATFALPAVIRELPAQAIRRHSEHILEALSQILHTGSELSVPSAQKEYEQTLELLLDKIGLFGPQILHPATAEDRQLFVTLVPIIFQNFYSLKAAAREIAAKLIEKIASKAQTTVADLAEALPYTNKQPSGGQGPPRQMSWRQHMWQEVERQASNILPYYRGGYTRVQKLIAYTDAVRFVLKHRISSEPIDQKVHTLLGVAELLLKILELEAQQFDQKRARAEPDPAPRRSPGVESPSSCAQKYMRLERFYISQNQEYDPYSHTQHPHELLTTQHFEVSYQAKREQERQTDEAVTNCSFVQHGIFANEGSLDRRQPAATAPLSEEDKQRLRERVDLDVHSFIQELFGGRDMGSRPSDINYDYVSHLYVLYPNVQQRTELICRCLEVLCDIVTHPGLDQFLQERQQAFFAPHVAHEQWNQDQTRRNERQGASKLETKLDFYAVEIKAKIIGIYFKYFQREEDNILGTAKACLERLLNEAYLPTEALPNQILKEGVRPALNVLSQPTHCPRAFKHLAMLIEVLHGCFNDQLAQHLLAACHRRQQAVRAPYVDQASAAGGPGSNMPPRGQGAAGAPGNMNGGGRAAGPGAPANGGPNGQDPSATLEHERRLVTQYNIDKVGSLETAKHIIQILHLLPNAREKVLRAIAGIPAFELQASRELETSHVPLTHSGGQSGLELRPLRVKFGVLQSEFRDGLAKFFNRNPVDCVVMLEGPQQPPNGGMPGAPYSNNSQMISLVLAILKMPSSYTVRERIARDLDVTIRPRLGAARAEVGRPGEELSGPLLAVRLVWTLTKFNSDFLCQPQHADILESLRWRWVGLSDLNVDNCPRPGCEQSPETQSEAMQDQKRLHRKILKCLLAYCRSEASDKQVLFDLLKGFSYQPIIDLAPLLKFFTEEVPKFSRRRQIGIMETALHKVEASRGTYEQRYAMFEFAFMPLALSCRDSQERFDELFSRSMIQRFFQIFFFVDEQRPTPNWRIIQNSLEHSAQVCYESFHVELIKALSIILLRVNDQERLQACLFAHHMPCQQIFVFLKEFAGRAVEDPAREWACYALTLLCLKILDYASMIRRVDQPNDGADHKNIKSLLREALDSASNVLPLVLRLNHKENLQQQGLQEKIVANLIRFWHECPRAPPELDLSGLDFAAALDREAAEQSRVPDLCRLVIQNAKVLNPFADQLQKCLYQLIRTASGRQSLSSCDLIIRAASTIVNWCSSKSSDGADQRATTQRLFRRISGHLTSLVHQNLAGHVREQSASEVEPLLAEVLKTLRTMIKIHPFGVLDAPGDRSGHSEQREVPLAIRVFELNASYLVMKYGAVDQDPALLTHILDSLQHVRSGEAKCTLLAIKMLEELIRQELGKDQPAEQPFQLLFSALQRHLSEDLDTCHRGLEKDNLLERPETQRQAEGDAARNSTRRWDAAALQEAREVSRSVPHFAVRLADCMDTLASRTPAGSPMRRLREKLLDFSFCKRLVATLLRVVGKGRRAIVTERPTYTKSDGPAQDQQGAEPEETLRFVEDVIDWQNFEPELDHFNKESVMLGLKFLAKRTHALPDDEAAHVLENLQWLPVALAQFRACDYITQEVDELIGILIQEEPGQERRLQAEKQQALVQRLLDRLHEPQERKPDRKRDTPAKVKLNNKLFESCIASLERQSSMSTDYANKLMEHLLICSKGRSVALKQRLFTVFERCHGQSLFKKLKFFFTAHQAESPTRVLNLFVISQLLDFCLMNFRIDAKLEKLPHSAKLHRLSCPQILIEKLSLEDQSAPNQQETAIRSCLNDFALKQRKYMRLRLSDLLDPLSEVISINPTYHDDKPIADILFTELFWQLWAILSRQEQQYLAECINKMFLSAIKHSQTLQQLLKPTTTFARTMLESVAALTPQIRLAPELLQFMAKELNLWHVAIPTLENHIVLCPKNERYVMALGEVYTRLYEEDYLAGLRRSITESEETRTIVTLGQHGNWEAINQLFAQYINFYAEQEGLYAHLDRHQGWPGKYSRQLPRQFLLSRFENSNAQGGASTGANGAAAGPGGAQGGINGGQDQQQDAQRQHREQARRYADLYERQVQDQVSPGRFPREGPNNKVSELDLRVWETLFIESLKVLNKWEQFRDIAHLHGNCDPGGMGDQSPGTHEMWIEFFWQKKDWENLAKYKSTLMGSHLIKYQLYYIFLIIQGHENQRFDEVFKKVIQLAHQEWETQLPNYVDRAQFESLIMFQQVVESSEGGRSMIREAKHLGGNERLKELKAAMNIWRERVPHQCESIKTWKEVLENRNFIYEQLCSFIQPQLNSQAEQQPGRSQGAGGAGSGGQHAMPHVELLDICWNLVKLASVSRKQGLPSLALHYQEAAEKKLGTANNNAPYDLLKYERFKLQYEVLKLELAHNTEDPESVEEKVKAIERSLATDSVFESWQKASLKQIIADFYLSRGRLRAAQEHLLSAISELTKRDPKIWMSYARLNETVYEHQKDEQSRMNALKGLLFATTLSLHKSRLIIPRILRLLRPRDRDSQSSEQIIEFVRSNTDQMPTWIWIFWAPQLLVMLQQQERPPIEHQIGKHLLGKLVTVYPQAAYYPLRANFTFCTGAPAALRDLLKRLKSRNPHVLLDIEMIGKEFGENVKPGPEESLCAWLQGLEIGTFFNRQDVHASVRSFLGRLYRNYLDDGARSASPLLRALAPGFQADFLDERTRETCILKALLRLKNLKDFLLSTINSRDQTTHLEELSPCLAHFNRRAIEIPGQHVLSEAEPLPQRTVYLDRFESLVQRSGLNHRKVVFKGNNSKGYPFSASPATDYARICSEERATQLKVLMNMIFQRHKETLRRGVKFCVPSKLIMYLSKLSQDDLTFQDFQETHDFLLQEKGVDPDIALLLQIRWVRLRLDNAPDGQQRGLASITPEHVKELNADYFAAMVGKSSQPDLCEDACFVPSSLLSSYFHRIFYNVDDLFLFKKRFTTYHAANSFFSYTFNQAEFQTLTSMSFCKSTGRLSFSEPRLKACHKPPQELQGQTMEAAEAADLEGARCMPFRLTANFVDFIGQIGLQGLFAGVMTSCSLAISHHAEKLHCFLALVLKDELLALPAEERANPPALDAVAYLNADYTMSKIKSLSNHAKVLELPRSQHDALAEEELAESKPHQWAWVGQQRVPAYMLDLQVTKPDMPEEFNKKVFKLMDLALDDARRRQMPTMWCPWF